MTPQAAFCLAVLAIVFVALVRSRIAPDVILLGGLTLLLATPMPDGAGGWRVGVLDAAEALAGLSNPGLVTVGALFIVAAGVRETGVIDAIARGALGSPPTLRRALLRIMLPVVGFSAFLNNTPVVAMMIPAVRDWSRKLGIAPSKLMMPLSYAAILGGTCTLIGTSTNLVVSGLVEQETTLGRLGIFDIAWIGLPCALVGGLFIVAFGPRLLPDRGSATSRLRDSREYTAEMLVPVGSPLAGRTVEGAGLRSLPGAYLVEVEREGELISAGPNAALARRRPPGLHGRGRIDQGPPDRARALAGDEPDLQARPAAAEPQPRGGGWSRPRARSSARPSSWRASVRSTTR
ncbi:MAG: SLC13 family permease [Planctomycetota bacterium]